MIKEILKPLILGFSIIIGVIIYTEQTKYLLIDSDTESPGEDYYLLDRSNGVVKKISQEDNGTRYYLRIKEINRNGRFLYYETDLEDLRKDN
jgi:hypothetical protein